MGKDLRLDVVTTSDGKGLLEAAGETEHLTDKVDDLGDKMRQTARDGGLLAIELEAVKVKQRELAAEFDYTGDKAILKTISSTRRYSGQLQKLKQDLENVGGAAVQEGEKLGADLGKNVESGMSSSVGDVPTMVPVLVGALTSPGTYGILAMAGEAMGGAILTGIGAVGIGSGIALSINDPKVQTAIARLREDVTLGLTDAASSFVGPLSGAVGDIDDEFRKLQPDIKSVFDQISPEVDELTHGAVGFLDELIPAFGRAIVAAKPLIDLLAEDLPGLGASLGGLFDTISRNSGAAELGLQEIINGTEAVINLVAGGIVILSELGRDLNDLELSAAEGARGLIDIMIKIADAAHLPDQGLKNIDGELDKVVDKLKANQAIAAGASSSMGAFSTSTGAAAGNVDRLSTELLNFNIQMGAMNHLLDRTESLNSLTIGMADFAKQLKVTKGAFDANTAAGAQNQNSYIGLIKQAQEYRQTLIDSGVPQAKADKAFQDMVIQIDKAADAAGWSKKQIDALNKQLGVTAALKPINVKINVTTAYSSTGERPSLGHNIPFLAGGGHFNPGPIVVGEDGPELLVPDSAGTIIPNMGSGGGGGHAPAAMATGMPATVQFAAVPGDAAAEFILSLLRPVIRGPYSGDLNAALAGNQH